MWQHEKPTRKPTFSVSGGPLSSHPISRTSKGTRIHLHFCDDLGHTGTTDQKVAGSNPAERAKGRSDCDSVSGTMLGENSVRSKRFSRRSECPDTHRRSAPSPEDVEQDALDDLARRAKLGLGDAAIQIGLGLLWGLAKCRNAVIDGTVLAYAGEDVTDELAWSLCNALAKAKLTLPGDVFDSLPIDWSRSLNP